MIVTKRKLDFRAGREGSAHDPYSWTELVVHLNNDIIVAHFGLISYLEVRDAKTSRALLRRHFPDTLIAELGLLFEQLTGIEERRFYDYYTRIHRDDIDDPFGPPSRYI